jgi:acyl-CoA synthetase (AMP-forming)/AMP-acid ligase II
MKLIIESGSELADPVRAVIDAATQGRPLDLFTSGTTGVPKLVSKDLRAALLKKQPGNPAEVWLLTYHPQRWAGVSVILHVLKTGATLCVPHSLSFADLIATAVKERISHLSLTPSLLRMLLLQDHGGLLGRVPLTQVTFGGEAATQSVLDLARRIWPQARLTHVYASTELGDICSVSDGREGVPAYKFDRCQVNHERELIVDGQCTGDLWEKRDDRYFFLGRVQELINVGGNKVAPIAVEEFALKCGARFARAFAIPSKLMGSLVGLEYVGDLDPDELAAQYRKQLPKPMCPVDIIQVTHIDLTAAGKNRRPVS